MCTEGVDGGRLPEQALPAAARREQAARAQSKLFMCPVLHMGSLGATQTRHWWCCVEQSFPPLTAQYGLQSSSVARRRQDELKSFVAHGLPEAEPLLDAWSSLQPPGWLYVTPRYVCFASNLAMSKDVWPFADIVSLQV